MKHLLSKFDNIIAPLEFRFNHMKTTFSNKSKEYKDSDEGFEYDDRMLELEMIIDDLKSAKKDLNDWCV